MIPLHFEIDGLKDDKGNNYPKVLYKILLNKYTININNANITYVNEDVGIGIDGNPVNLSLWNYSLIGNDKNSYSLNKYLGNIIDGKIIDTVPTVINNKPVTVMYYTFFDCKDLIHAPKIPNSIISMFGTFNYCKNLKHVPEIPDKIKYMNFTFDYCINLKQAPNIPNSLIEMQGTFRYCINLTGEVFISDTLKDITGIFHGTKKNITMTYSKNNIIADKSLQPININKKIIYK
jgi:hypothetical protein